jgi:hypothetical protein
MSKKKFRFKDLFPEHDKNKIIDDVNLDKYDMGVSNKNINNIDELKLEIPKEIYENINIKINEFKSSNLKVSQYLKEAINFITLAEKGFEHINEHSNFFTRIWDVVTGSSSHEKLQSSVHLSSAQKACVQMINEMNKQYLLTQEQILMLSNMIHYMVKEENEFRKKLVERLENIIVAVKKRFEYIEIAIKESIYEIKTNRDYIRYLNNTLNELKIEFKEGFKYLYKYIRKVDRRVDTLVWLQLIDAYDNKYSKIEFECIKFMNVVMDFYKYKSGNFTFEDLKLLAIGLQKANFDLSQNITIEDFIIKFYDEYFKDKKYLDIHNKLSFIADALKIINYEAYYDFNNNKTPLIHCMNIATYFLINHIEIFDADNNNESLKNFINKINLKTDAKFNWFLLACEILSYMKSLNIETDEDTDKIYLVASNSDDKASAELLKKYLNENFVFINYYVTITTDNDEIINKTDDIVISIGGPIVNKFTKKLNSNNHIKIFDEKGIDIHIINNENKYAVWGDENANATKIAVEQFIILIKEYNFDL